MYEAISERIAVYDDQEIVERLGTMERADRQGKPVPELKNMNKAKMIRQRGEEPLRQAFYWMSGVDLRSIDAVGVGGIQVVLTEYGPDLSRFPTEKEFVSPVTLSPRKPVTGGKPIKKKNKRGSASSRVAGVLRAAALSLRHSQTALGASIDGSRSP
jgi:hypothetical protein